MIIFTLALLALVICVAVAKAARAIPPQELRRRARTSNRKAASIYKMTSYGSSLDIFLWLLGSVSFTVLLIVIAAWAWWLALLFVSALAWIWFGVHIRTASGWVFGFAAILAPAISWLLSYLQPILGRLGGLVRDVRTAHHHTGLYEKDDLLELIKNQNSQSDSRIPQSDLKIVFGALKFGDKTVGSAMTPRRKIKIVASSDAIGPHLMDELHASGFSRFPVVKDSTKLASPEIIGTLYMKDLVGHPETGRVRDVMKNDVFFINEAQTLRDALAACIKTQHHLLIVVNNFEEIVGVLSLEDIVEQILGEKITDEFDKYDDLRAVAGLEAQKERSKHSVPEVVK